VILVTAHVVVRPSDREDLMTILTEVQAASRLDDGCEYYGYFESVDEPNVFSAIEMWRDREALDAHLRQPHIARLVEALGKYTAERPDIRAHDVRASGPLRG
jgi:quinol monooxygenase YgiN